MMQDGPNRHLMLYAQMCPKEIPDNIPVLVDTGASVSLLPIHWFNLLPPKYQNLKPTNLGLYTGNGVDIPIKGVFKLRFFLLSHNFRCTNHHCYEHEFIVTDNDTLPLLGMDFFVKHNTIIDLEKKTLTIDGILMAMCDSMDLALKASRHPLQDS